MNKSLNSFFFSSFVLGMILLLASCSGGEKRILVFSKTKGFRHESIAAGKAALIKLGQEKKIKVDTTEDAEVFTEEKLKNYSTVVFLSTTGDVLNHFQQNEFMRFIQAGGGYVGIHAAADTEYDWWWYGKLVGAYFKSHPHQQKVKVLAQPVKEGGLKLNAPEPWERFDELYNYKKISPDINVLFKLDEKSYEGGENDGDHPIIWYHDFDGGRSFYTGFGHTNESYQDPVFLDQLWTGLNYAIGENKLDFSKATAKHVPEANRFTKKVFGFNFDEPTEMTILPDGRIMFLERKGKVKLYEPAKDSFRVINEFNVYKTFEDGMLGLAADPAFATNHFVYIYYSHPEKSANVLSRFVFDGNALDMKSEKEIISVGTQRETCCHTGGSIAFGPDGNLFLSTGDNTSPFESDGFSPADEGKGRSPFDAQKSSANTNDLRGKILRIHVEADGSYTIPEGNLFPKGEANTRPEIYVMGCRNPYRISVDQKTGFLYWGEVGPDAGEESAVRGPRGYDEVNQAQKAGFFGWPLFVGNNYAYAKYDFQKKTVGPRHDPANPKNTSPNNTGKVDLPPANPAFIWYPYAQSPDFPLMKEGGRNAMAGPVYYSENFKDKADAYPDYFDGKLIIYDWMRNWLRLVTMDKNGIIMDIEPFLEGTTFNNTIDMAFGPDGRLYTLEYGTKWFAQNMDARLSVIEFNKGNRPPVAKLKADKISGAVPLTVSFSTAGTQDPDKDKLNFELDANGTIQKSETGDFTVTFDKPGVYRPKLSASDPQGSKSTDELVIVAGNEPPKIEIAVNGNSTYYFANSTADYQVKVMDKEDGNTDDGTIKPEKVMVTVDFLQQRFDETEVAQGHQRPELPGKILMAESDCKACHQIDQKSAGPSFKEVAKKYKTDVQAIEKLSEKILKGGSGVWGAVAMAAHPQLKKEQTVQMVEYILTLADESKNKSLPLKGVAKFGGAPKEGIPPLSAYLISASYEDNGSNGAPSLTSTRTLMLKAPVLTGADVAELTGGARKLSAGGNDVIENIHTNASALFKDVDLTSVGKLDFVIAEMPGMKGGQIEVYLDSPTGQKLGIVDFAKAPKIEVMKGIFMRPASLSVSNLTGKKNVWLVFKNSQAGEADNLFFFSRIILGK
ncbi:MAG: ThuA domain-containing protein [Bacteroidetes bacterium]|nr:ThuA domain-containing protein [Bacteroidota bacterium]